MEQIQMEQTSLKIETHENQTLAEAMAMKLDAPFLLAYSTTRCTFAHWDSEGKKVVTLDGDDMTNVYEVRAFGENLELRWVKDASDDLGRVTILCEIAKGDEYNCLPGEYLLWGEVTNERADAGYVVLSEGQVGMLTVPSSPTSTQLPVRGSRIALLFKEYFKPDDKYGNLVLIAERLFGLKMLESK
jgi:CRISPR-associated protein (TIGR03984 family)